MSPLIPPQAPQLHVPYDKRAASQDSPRTHLGTFAFTYATFSFWRNPGSAAPSNTINRRFLYIRFYNYSGRARISSLEATVTLVPLSVISTCPTRLWVSGCMCVCLCVSGGGQGVLSACMMVTFLFTPVAVCTVKDHRGEMIAGSLGLYS